VRMLRKPRPERPAVEGDAAANPFRNIAMLFGALWRLVRGQDQRGMHASREAAEQDRGDGAGGQRGRAGRDIEPRDVLQTVERRRVFVDTERRRAWHQTFAGHGSARAAPSSAPG